MHNNDLEACGMKCWTFWFHSKVKFLTRFWRLFGLTHFALFQCNFYRFLCGTCKVFNLHLFCVISMFVSGRCYIKDLNAWRILMNFLCIYLREKKGGGSTNACICMGTQSAFTTEPLNGCLRNLVGMKWSWPRTCIKMFWPYLPRGESRVKQK